jgi:hypothetical protein
MRGREENRERHSSLNSVMYVPPLARFYDVERKYKGDLDQKDMLWGYMNRGT